MKRLFLLACVFCLSQLVVEASMPYAEVLNLGVQSTGNGTVTISLTQDDGITATTSAHSTSSPVQSPIITGLVMPGTMYYVTITWTKNVTEYHANIVPPHGYQIFINNQPNIIIDSLDMGGYAGTTIYPIELRPLSDLTPRAVGSFSGVQLGSDVGWQVGLGAYRHGLSAGLIRFFQNGLASNPAHRSSLSYAQPVDNGDITATADTSGALSTISVPGAYVTLVDDDSSGNGYKINLFSKSTDTSPWKIIHVESPAANQLKITETEGTVSRVSFVTAPAFASGSATWTLQEGDGTTWVRTTTHTSTGGSSYPAVGGTRDDVVTVQTGGTSGATVAKTRYHYVVQPWGAEEITQIVADPDNAALTTNYTYYTNSANPGNYTHVQTVADSTGNWTSYQYYDDWLRCGEVRYLQQPFTDAPATPPATIDPTSASSGSVTAYDYATGWTGHSDLISSKIVTVNGTRTSQGSATWSETLIGGLFMEQASSTLYRDASHTQAAFAENCIEDPTQVPDQAGLPYLQQGADQSSTVWSRAGGDFDTSAKTFTVNTHLGYWRTLAVHGSTNSTGASAVTSWGGQTFASVFLLANKSTMDVVIRDRAANVIRTETWVYTGLDGSGNAQFSRLTYQDNTYDQAGRLTQSVDNNGATVSNTIANGQLTSSIDASGTEVQSTSFDAIGRPLTVVKKGASAVSAGSLDTSHGYAVQPDITTTCVYDAAGHVTSETVSGGTHSLVTTRTYDLAGRQIQQVDPGSYTTGIAYSSGGRVVTATLPGGATKVTEAYPDGQLKQVSGTGVVGVVCTYSMDTAGLRWTQEVDGGYTSSYKKSATDWLGRTVQQTVPGWNGTPVSRTWTYNDNGQLSSLSQPGLANTLYVYDTLGALYRQGLDVNGNGTLDLSSDDRISETQYSIFIDGSSRAIRQISSWTYPTSGSGTAKKTGETDEYLSNLGSGVIKLASATDIYGNVSTSTTTVDRTNKKVQTTVHLGASTIDASTVAYNGLTVETRDNAGIVMRAGYDDLERKVSDFDPRITSAATLTTTYKSGSSQIDHVTDATGVATASYTYDTAGRVATVTNAPPFSQVARYEYTLRGERLHEWGDTPYPVEYGYDAVGRMISLKTYRAGSGWSGATWPTSTTGTGDQTQWVYDDGTHSGDHGTGLLVKKLDAASQPVAYTYTQAGQALTRTWARGVTTTYGYSATTGELTSTSYSDSVNVVSYTYNRLGQLATAGDTVTGTHTFAYNLAGTLEMQNEQLPAFLASKIITWKYDTATGSIGRNKGFQLGVTGSLGADNDIAYSYDTYGRFNNLVAKLASEATSSNFTYTYTTSSNLINTLTESNSSLVQARSYEANRDLVSGFATTLPSRNLATYAYTSDVLGRRTVKVETGELYSRYGPGLVTKYGYNPRSEVISSQTFLGTDPTVSDNSGGDALPGRNYHYGYDSIGNRTATTTNGQVSTYTTNNLNEVQSRTAPGSADVAGFAVANDTVTVASQPTARQFDYFYRQQAFDNSAGPLWASLTIAASGPGGAASQTRNQYIAKSLESFAYDLDGNMTTDGHWDYTWDAENRLIAMQTTVAAKAATVPNQRIEFAYDYLGRRVRKKVYSLDVSNNPTSSTDTRFVYSTANWHLLAEYDANNSNALLRAYSWGLDLSGTTGGAGGVGGLLAIRDVATTATYLPVYDANGNVFALVNRDSSSGALAACYEYDAFGNTLRATGSSAFAAKNPFRYSTKYTDAETQLVYYGYRYYSPSLGRFLGRDSLQEKGGSNLFGFCANNAVNHWDMLGNVIDSVKNYGNEGGIIVAGNQGSVFGKINPPTVSVDDFDSIGYIQARDAADRLVNTKSTSPSTNSAVDFFSNPDNAKFNTSGLDLSLGGDQSSAPDSAPNTSGLGSGNAFGDLNMQLRPQNTYWISGNSLYLPDVSRNAPNSGTYLLTPPAAASSGSCIAGGPPLHLGGSAISGLIDDHVAFTAVVGVSGQGGGGLPGGPAGQGTPLMLGVSFNADNGFQVGALSSAGFGGTGPLVNYSGTLFLSVTNAGSLNDLKAGGYSYGVSGGEALVFGADIVKGTNSQGSPGGYTGLSLSIGLGGGMPFDGHAFGTYTVGTVSAGTRTQPGSFTPGGGSMGGHGAGGTW